MEVCRGWILFFEIIVIIAVNHMQGRSAGDRKRNASLHRLRLVANKCLVRQLSLSFPITSVVCCGRGFYTRNLFFFEGGERKEGRERERRLERAKKKKKKGMRRRRKRRRKKVKTRAE